MDMMTTRQVAKYYQDEADQSSHRNGLWKGAYIHIARICRVQHRSRAIKRLRSIADSIKEMSVSSAYYGAANQLAAENNQYPND